MKNKNSGKYPENKKNGTNSSTEDLTKEWFRAEEGILEL